MSFRKRILSYLLLAVYMLVVAHQSNSYVHSIDIEDTAAHDHSHQHAEDDQIHHDHQFHIGIFHFLGHLFEGIDHVETFNGEQLVIVNQSSTKKYTNTKFKESHHFAGNIIVLNEVYHVDSKNQTNRHTSYLLRTDCPAQLLRGPPFAV